MRMAIWESPIRIWAVRHKKKRQKIVHFNQTDGADSSSCRRTLKAEYTFSQVNPRSSSLRQLAVTFKGTERFAEANAGQQPAVAVTARGIMILP